MFHLKWLDKKGQVQIIDARGMDISKAGLCVESSVPLEPGAAVRVQSEDPELKGSGVVRHCSPHGEGYAVGLSFTVEPNWRKMPAKRPVEHTNHSRVDDTIDFYELLQISPGAEPQIVHRVYHMMAARFHPDNAETGNLEKFLALKRAYEVLANPERRASYDRTRKAREDEPMPIFEMKDFVDGMEGEVNRRLGVLSLLYNKRRVDYEHPGLSMLDLERRMNFPREHLSFTLWYLRSKGYVTVEDNSDCALTAAGADYVEEHWPDNVILQRLIAGPGSMYVEEKRKTTWARQNAVNT